MTFERTRDYRLIRSILTLPRIYPWMCDQFSPPAERFEVNRHPQIEYVLAKKDGGLIVGLFSFFPESMVCWSGHIAMLPKVHPRITHQAGQEMIEWLDKKTPCCRLIASIPTCNRAAIIWAKRAMGLTQYGVNEQSFFKDDRLWDQILLGRSLPGRVVGGAHLRPGSSSSSVGTSRLQT